MLHSIHFASIVNNSNISVAYKNKHVFLAARRAYGWLRKCFPHLCIPESKLKESSFWALGELYSRHKLLSLLGLLIEHDRNHVRCLIGSSMSHGRAKSKCGDTDSIGK